MKDRRIVEWQGKVYLTEDASSSEYVILRDGSGADNWLRVPRKGVREVTEILPADGDVLARLGGRIHSRWASWSIAGELGEWVVVECPGGGVACIRESNLVNVTKNQTTEVGLPDLLFVHWGGNIFRARRSCAPNYILVQSDGLWIPKRRNLVHQLAERTPPAGTKFGLKGSTLYFGKEALDLKIVWEFGDAIVVREGDDKLSFIRTSLVEEMKEVKSPVQSDAVKSRIFVMVEVDGQFSVALRTSSGEIVSHCVLTKGEVKDQLESLVGKGTAEYTFSEGIHPGALSEAVSFIRDVAKDQEVKR